MLTRIYKGQVWSVNNCPDCDYYHDILVKEFTGNTVFWEAINKRKDEHDLCAIYTIPKHKEKHETLEQFTRYNETQGYYLNVKLTLKELNKNERS